MTKLEKQLISLSAHGVWIEFAHGHRWLKCAEDNEDTDGYTEQGFNLHESLKEHGIMVNNKIYGGVNECILIIDEVLKKMNGYTLESWFDDILNKYDVESESSSGYKSRIDYNTNGGLY